MVTTVGLSNVVWPLLFANWLLEGRWQEKWKMARESRLLQAFAVLFLLHVVALLWSSDLTTGLLNIVDMLPLMAVPLVLLTTQPPEGNTRRFILNFYGLTVFVVTVIGFIRWLTIPDLPHREIVTYISHIRFSLNICMVIFLLVASARTRTSHTTHSSFFIPHSSFFKLLLILWFLFILLLLQSYTAFVILAVASLVAILMMPATHSPTRKNRRLRWLVLWLLGATLVTVMIVLGCRSYYSLDPLASQPLREYTANGRPYKHQQDGFIENGNYVNNYICHEELASEWPRRSPVSLDSLTASGHPVESALIRYLNALGLPKDSSGIAALTDAQVEEIARGVANPVYEHGFPLKKMLYVTLFEIENYRCYQAVIGFTMLQRLELWNCAWRVIREHPWIGTGTGDLSNEMHTQFVAMNSPMLQRELLPHNQYLTLIALFGFLGFALILLFFLRAWRSSIPAIKQSNIPTFMPLWLTTILLSFLTENTLDSLPGILFCTWFLAFRHKKC